MTRFSAAAATLGYLYQVRSALLWALQRQRTQPGFYVSVETLDDVTFETTLGEPTDLLQTKHHRRGIGNLTDASTDLWKTLRIWFEAHAKGLISEDTSLHLITTSKAPKESAAAFLRAFHRDVATALTLLGNVARASGNKANTPAYKMFLDTEHDERRAILERVVVFDAAPNIQDLSEALTQELHWAVAMKHNLPFRERLEGWWFQRVIQQLSNPNNARIESNEIELQIGVIPVSWTVYT